MDTSRSYTMRARADAKAATRQRILRAALEVGQEKMTIEITLDVEPTPTEAFEAWWATYSKKVGKEAAHKAFKRVLKNGQASLAELMAKSAAYADHREMTGTDGGQGLSQPG